MTLTNPTACSYGVSWSIDLEAESTRSTRRDGGRSSLLDGSFNIGLALPGFCDILR